LTGDPVVKFEGDNFFLSNFFPAEVTINGYSFPTNEHAFQAAKYRFMVDVNIDDMTKYVNAVQDAPTPAKAKYLGRSVKIDLKAWDANKIDVMRDVCKAKFDQHDDLRELLVNTGGGMLVEVNTWGDVFWGRVDGKGRNVLGSILLELRGHYIHGK